MYTYQARRVGRSFNVWLLPYPHLSRSQLERLISLLSDSTPHNHQAADMIVPYLQIAALTFFRFVATAHAIPSGTSLEARTDGLVAGVAANPPSDLLSRRGLPVNIMQNTDDSRPVVPVDNYKQDIGRLAGGQQ
ncbi:hypothetical protein C8Q70DRAFT_1057440 [Cubamyces menziesii]|uniref:Uncharacterized protein n=1 Tax=Trametes cubensis TaxID=1111947 RepID=A0AAD7U4W9_9APHY|nr:hypothetical protein C8Q70DRAFT_1057440 [Cubamyces menziesii]KAJ8496950.1 hypothetical protein ONZ51_g804 [Trametes cubensis]